MAIFDLQRHLCEVNVLLRSTELPLASELSTKSRSRVTSCSLKESRNVDPLAVNCTDLHELRVTQIPETVPL